MDWNVVAALTQIVSTIAVVVSLLYLARQMKQSTATARGGRLPILRRAARSFNHGLSCESSANGSFLSCRSQARGRQRIFRRGSHRGDDVVRSPGANLRSNVQAGARGRVGRVGLAPRRPYFLSQLSRLDGRLATG